METYQTKKGAKARKQRIKEQGTSKPKKKQKTIDVNKYNALKKYSDVLKH